jgi:hypothetical protein
MNTFARLSRLSTLLLVGVAAACSESTVGPDEADFDFAGDVALIVADAVAEDLAVMSTAVPGGLFASDAERTTTRTRTFFDASGAVMDRYDRELTASITTVTETTGSASRSELEMTLARTRTMTVSGLEGEETERTFNGSGTDDRTRVRTNDEIGTRSYVLSGTHTTTNVVRSVDRQANPWPLSGTIARSITVEVTNGPNGDETRSTNATLTFDGTQFAELNVDGEIFEIDLSKRGRSSVRRR